ncbi:hypothetical protein BKA61DRAFT_677915 [Leptodontidium sp. MPI-SDFR-AT-0119]|nr:hypothetical protein BKA61DRAFT_677915 [Leptodontidium sp. MPI-SDFR-AT-0119]
MFINSADKTHPLKQDTLAQFPAKLHSELCWTPESYARRPLDYIFQLSADELASVKRNNIALGLPDIAMICPENFPLPTDLAWKLRELSITIHSGRGFIVLRGLNPQRCSEEDNVIAFCGISRYIGRHRADHLRDAIRDPKPMGREHVELHPSKMMVPLRFHADHDRVVPDALRILAEDFPWPGVVDDKPQTTYTPWQALNTLEKVANENSIEVDVQVGDIQLVNNLAIFHARSGWVDHPGHESHYYRSGLHDPENAWARPIEYEGIFDDHLKTLPQVIPVTGFDPYGLTSLEMSGHG